MLSLEQLPQSPGMLPIAEVRVLLSGSPGCPPCPQPHHGWDFSVWSHLGPQTSLSLRWGKPPVGLEKAWLVSRWFLKAV